MVEKLETGAIRYNIHLMGDVTGERIIRAAEEVVLEMAKDDDNIKFEKQKKLLSVINDTWDYVYVVGVSHPIGDMIIITKDLMVSEPRIRAEESYRWVQIGNWEWFRNTVMRAPAIHKEPPSIEQRVEVIKLFRDKMDERLAMLR